MQRPDPRSAFYAWKNTVSETTAQDMREVWSAAYLMGARDAIKASAAISELVPMLALLIQWLESDPEWVTGAAEPVPEATATANGSTR